MREIPPLVVGPLAEEREPVLLWVRTGTAAVEAAGTSHALVAGQAIWVPPGVVHATRTDPGAVVFPLFPLDPHGGELPDVLSEVRVVAIPAGWEDWLVHQWLDKSHVRDALPGADALVDLVAGASPGGGVAAAPGALPLPRSREARDVARALMRDPGSPWRVDALAARQSVSAKTLQRQFLRETGMALSVWRTRARIAVAARLLAEGRDIGWTGRQVGYTTPTGFTRAFRRHTGLTPRDYARRGRARPRGAAPPVAEVLGHAVALTSGAPPPPPPVPRHEIWEQVNDCHVLMWAHRGEGRVRIGARGWSLRQGQAMWVPAGATHTLEIAADSLVVTIGNVHAPVRVGVDELAVFAFPAEDEAFLLHTLVAEYTLFRPPGDGASFADELFREQFMSRRDDGTDGLTGVVGDLARALRRDPGDPRPLAAWAGELGTSAAGLGRELTSQTGTTFPRWRARLRMDVARELLHLGESPGAVSRRLGYAGPAAFTRAFTAAHGIPPREYRRREARRREVTT